MRLFLVPISTRRALIYARPLQNEASRELSLLDKATGKAAKTWASWEEAKGGWKKHLVTWGNRVQQRIPFEEWGLKSIPSLTSQRRSDETHGTKKIDVLFPGNAVRLEKLPSVLHTIATERQEFHRKKMIWSLGFAPITAPFALVPMYVVGGPCQRVDVLTVAIRAVSRIFLSSTLSTVAGPTGGVSPCPFQCMIRLENLTVRSVEWFTSPRISC